MGMYSGKGGSHDTYAPTEWPLFTLNGSIVEQVAAFTSAETQRLTEPAQWFWDTPLHGRDSYLHLRPCHVAIALEKLLEAQLLEPSTTSFTVVAPAVGLQRWRKYLKHFRHREVHLVTVQGLGAVKHWLLRFERADGLLARGLEREAPIPSAGKGEKLGEEGA